MMNFNTPIQQPSVIKEIQYNQTVGLQIETNQHGIYIRWDNGTIQWYDFQLELKQTYDLQSQHFCLSDNPVIFYSVNRNGMISSINIQTGQIEIFKKSENKK